MAAKSISFSPSSRVEVSFRFPQMSLIASELGTTVSQILAGDESLYNKTVVHCMNEFDNDKNREKILDIMDNYMDIFDAYKATI